MHFLAFLAQVMAPQVEGYGQAADIWSFGITMLEVHLETVLPCCVDMIRQNASGMKLRL